MLTDARPQCSVARSAASGTQNASATSSLSTIVTSGPNGDRVSVVEYLLIWRRDARGRLRIIVDYYRY